MSTGKRLWRFKRRVDADRVLPQVNAWMDLRDALLHAWGPIAVRAVWYPAQGRTEKLWEVDATLTLHMFSLWCAEDVLSRSQSHGRTLDYRSLRAIDTLRRYIAGEVSAQALETANADALQAAEDSVRSWHADYEQTMEPLARVAVAATLTDPVAAAQRAMDVVERYEATIRIREATDRAAALQAVHSLPDWDRSAPLLRRLEDVLLRTELVRSLRAGKEGDQP